MSKIRTALTLTLALCALLSRPLAAAPLIEALPTQAQATSPLMYARDMQIVEIARPQPKPAVAARPQPKMRSIRVMATAYALRGRTAGGTQTTHGTIAVDPRLIPLGTRLYVPGYGWGKALDTGGAIRGNVIDLWMPSNSQCFAWGVRTVQILVEEVMKPSRQGHPHVEQLASRGGRKKLSLKAPLKPAAEKKTPDSKTPDGKTPDGKTSDTKN